MKVEKIVFSISRSVGCLLVAMEGNFEYHKEKGVLKISTDGIVKYVVEMRIGDFRMKFPVSTTASEDFGDFMKRMKRQAEQSGGKFVEDSDFKGD